jgi:bifunctional non-homologous end joining protein LigD
MLKTTANKPRPRQRARAADSLRRRPLRKPDAHRPALPLQQMPDWQEPCLALLKAKPPTGPRWAFEIKWDGYRVSVRLDRGKARILTRRGHDWTERFPTIAAAAEEKFAGRSLIVDGEAVVLDEKGRPDFSWLQKALGTRGNSRNPGNKAAHEAMLYAFDLLYLDGRDLRRLPLETRREELEQIVSYKGVIRLSEEIVEDGATLLRHSCEMGLEGIIAKDRKASYRSGRTGDWLKIKCIQSETFAVVGYEVSTSVRGAIASLLLGAREGGKLIYAGSVGTGFKRDEVVAIKQQLDKMVARTPPVDLKGKGLVFVRPDLAAEVEFRGWTSDGKLRHASFKGFREKADNASVFDMADRAK